MSRKIEYLKTITGPQLLQNSNPLPRYPKINFGNGFNVIAETFKNQNTVTIDEGFITDAVNTINFDFSGGTWSKGNVPAKLQFGTINASANVDYTIAAAQGTQKTKLMLFLKDGDDIVLFNKLHITMCTTQDIDDWEAETDINIEQPGYPVENTISTSDVTLTYNFENESAQNLDYIIFHFNEIIALD
jgi:hypothetical protein